MIRGLLVVALLMTASGVHAQSTDEQVKQAKVNAVRQAWAWTHERCPFERELSFELVGSGRVRPPTLDERLEKAIDPHLAAIITINPEGRVKVERGPAAITFEPGWPTPVAVKIINEAGLTTRLQVKALGDDQTSAHFFESIALRGKTPAITSELCGADVEYQAMLIRCGASSKREVTLSFTAGANSQDLGFRAEVPVLLTPRINRRLPRFIQNDAALLSADADTRKQARLNLQSRIEMVTGSTLDRRSSEFDLKVHGEEKVGNILRQKISYRALDGQRLTGYLLKPIEPTGKLPSVLCLHQTTKWGSAEPAGLGGLPNLHYALELAQRGYITVAPDYPGYGDATSLQTYGQDYESTTCQGIIYHRRAVDLLCSLPEVDANRIGCIGHSLGGHNTLFLGLFDDRIKALATSCGFCSFPKYYGGNLKGWSHAGYMPRIASLYQCDPKQMPFDWPEVLAALAPRPVFINAPVGDENFNMDGVRDCVKFAQPVYQLLEQPKCLEVHHPQVGHDFPKDVREKCYGFFDRHLK
jgi:dienelactone hydrolase